MELYLSMFMNCLNFSLQICQKMTDGIRRTSTENNYRTKIFFRANNMVKKTTSIRNVKATASFMQALNKKALSKITQ